MEYQAHRGVATEFPENTMPAFQAAAKQGYTYIELDPVFTKDGQCVVLHDKTLNRTCRYPDGSVLPEKTSIGDITYKEALAFDCGISKSVKHRGAKIPLLKDVLSFAKKADLTVKIDNRVADFSEEQIEKLFDVVAGSGDKVAFTAYNVAFVEKVLARFPKAEIHYDGEVSEAVLCELSALLKYNRWYVWLPIACPATSWVKIATADERLCSLVKKYAKLGLWIVNRKEDYELAEKLGADLIETAGQIKPQPKENGIFDCHSHTFFSHDSQNDPRNSLVKAKEIGLQGFAVTDHCDIEFSDEMDVPTPICQSVELAKSLGPDVLCGVEIGEAFWHPSIADGIMKANDFDIVLGSVHAVRYQEYTMPYSGIDFSKFIPKMIDEYLQAYFADILEMIETVDFDVLSHLTCPLRYICGKYGITVDLATYEEVIGLILQKIIEKGIALEINTSGLGSAYDTWMPDKEIVKKYLDMGGYLITLGADAHQSQRIGHGFDEAMKELSCMGVKHVYYYKKRIPFAVKI